MEQGGRELYGWTQAEVRGRPLFELLEPVDAESGTHLPDERRLGQWDGEYRVRRKDGSFAVVYARIQATLDDDGTRTGVASVAVAVSKRRAVERGRRDRGGRTWLTRVETAIAGDGFELYGQPIVDVLTNDVVQRELLLRMRADDPGAVIAPGLFLPAAEQSGLISEIDRWVINRSVDSRRPAARSS